MMLKVLGSGSTGNCMLLTDDNETLVLDAGINFNTVLRELGYNVQNVVGCVVTHEHTDHDGYSDKIENAGIEVFRAFQSKKKVVRYGNFTIQAFPLVHDVPCYGFFVKHPSFGSLVYITDTEYVPINFRGIGLDYIIVECNYDKSIMDKDNINSDHVYTGHMELGTTMEFLRVNATENLKKVVLCHLSNVNIDRSVIECYMDDAGYNYHIAGKGLNIKLGD